MFKSLLLIMAAGAVSIHYSDLESDAVLVSMLLPLLAVVSFIALALWLVILFHRRGISQTASPGGDSGSDFVCGGDGGGD